MVHRQYGEQMLLLPIRVEGTECTYSTTMMFDEEGARLPNTHTMKELGLSEDLFLRLFEVYSVIVKGLGGPRLHEEVQAIKAKIVEAAVHRSCLLFCEQAKREEDADRALEDAEELSDAPLADEEKWAPQQGDAEWEEETQAKLAALNGWTTPAEAATLDEEEEADQEQWVEAPEVDEERAGRREERTDCR
jgi:hypothetical protein